MKTRAFFYILPVLAASAALVACNKEGNISGDVNTDGVTKLVPMTFNAEGESCSRTGLQDDNSVFWSPGDCICVFPSSGKKYKFVTDITETSATALFHGEIEESDSYIAYYPYPKEEGHTLGIEGNEFTFYVPEEQPAVNGSFDSSLNPSLAIAEGGRLFFKNLCSHIKFTFTGTDLGDVRKVSITDNNMVPLSQIVDYDLETGICKYRVPKGGYPVSIVSDKFVDGGVYYFVIPPFEGALSGGFTISFYDGNGVAICSKSTDMKIDPAPGTILNMGTLEVKRDVDYEIAEDGTYLVYKANGLKAWANNILDYNNTDINKWKTGVRLMNDITFGENEYWTPIGNASNGFTGTFDGNGKTIKGLKIGRSGSKDIRNAIFGKLGGNGVIKNLTVESPVCYGGTYLSVLASSCEKGSSIINCHVNDARLECIFGGSSGIICGGLYEGYIEGCTATGTVTGKGINEVGGLVGIFSSQAYDGSENPLMVCCSFKGTVTGNGNYYGGIAGKMGGQAKGCYAVASVSGNGYVGGLFGAASGYNSLTASYFKGSVSGTSNTGLLIGNVNSSTFTPVNAYYCQDGGDVSVAVGNKDLAEFIKIENNVWDDAITDMNNNMGAYSYQYVWDDTKQHPVLQATE